MYVELFLLIFVQTRCIVTSEAQKNPPLWSLVISFSLSAWEGRCTCLSFREVWHGFGS